MKAITALILLAAIGALAQQTLFPRKGTIWLMYEEDGHVWMTGAAKQSATADDDPGFVQTDFIKHISVRLQGGKETILFHNCCTSNVLIGTNFTGTIQVGAKFYRVKDLK